MIEAPRIRHATDEEIRAGICELRERRPQVDEQVRAICEDVRREVAAWVKRQMRHNRRWAA